MLWIPSAQLLPDLGITVLPKASEVLRYLDGSVRRREEVDGGWDLKATDAGCVENAEEVLNAGLKPRGLSDLVGDWAGTPGRERDGGWGNLV
jgi:hypothetical protein